MSWHLSHLQGPNSPGKHWKAAQDKVSRGRAELRAEKITQPGQGPRAAARQIWQGLMLLHHLLSSDIHSSIYRHQTGT